MRKNVGERKGKNNKEKTKNSIKSKEKREEVKDGGKERRMEVVWKG